MYDLKISDVRAAVDETPGVRNCDDPYCLACTVSKLRAVIIVLYRKISMRYLEISDLQMSLALIEIRDILVMHYGPFIRYETNGHTKAKVFTAELIDQAIFTINEFMRISRNYVILSMVLHPCTVDVTQTTS